MSTAFALSVGREYTHTLYSKSQIAIEYSFHFKESNPTAHVLWLYVGNIARFYQRNKRNAQSLEMPGWDDSKESVLELVCSWLSNTASSYLLIVDNADNTEHWWLGKYSTSPEAP